MAGSYINMQDAFAIEKDGIGNWKEIGYTAPGIKGDESSFGSQNFVYTGAAVSESATAVNDAWKATAKSKLNDCNKGSWSMTATYAKLSTSNSKAGNVVYSDYNANANCQALTPAWKNLFSNS